jgi:hypothetical protein
MRSFRSSLVGLALVALASMSMPVLAADIPDGDGIAYANLTINTDGAALDVSGINYVKAEAIAINSDAVHVSGAKLAVFPSGGEGGDGDDNDILAASDFHPNQRLNL